MKELLNQEVGNNTLYFDQTKKDACALDLGTSTFTASFPSSSRCHPFHSLVLLCRLDQPTLSCHTSKFIHLLSNMKVTFHTTNLLDGLG
ncbi:hypothetical protein YC2023_042195 [Brassica napus]